MSEQHYALYLHIPFCHHICHYCDFAKTALFDEDLVQRYFDRVNSYLKEACRQGMIGQLQSIFIGGGTPGMFSREFEEIFQTLHPYIGPDTEVTLEANPSDIHASSLKIWKDLGINRLSIGIQTFEPKGLQFLTRRHSSKEGKDAILMAKEVIPNLNVDLIYGWNEQTLSEWEMDLDTFITMDIPHLSCYSLTYEPGTVFGRKVSRGVLKPTDDSRYNKMYDLAKLKLSHLQHEEISNWSKLGYSCRHNWTYWRGLPFLGFGVGSHGFLKTDGLGSRYSFTKNLKEFMNLPVEDFFRKHPSPHFEWVENSSEQWLIEKIGCGFRTCEGLDLEELQTRSKMTFQPNALVSKAIEKQLILIEGNSIKLSQKEWIRENSWCGELIDCFHRL